MLQPPPDMEALYALDDVDLAHLTSPARPNHRRVRSDPTEIDWVALRGQQAGLLRAEQYQGPFGGGAGAGAGASEPPTGASPIRAPAADPAAALKRVLSPMQAATGYSPLVKKQLSMIGGAEGAMILNAEQLRNSDGNGSTSSSPSEDESDRALPPPVPFGLAGQTGLAPLPLGAPCHEKTEPNYNKKDVPMWTVEEDLLILQLVEQHGKRWSKIAAHLPGRTDNGVRNRWNRMERAQLLKKSRGPAAGYRCRRCGEPKRGHICAARMMLSEAPEGDDLHQKAAALTELSAAALKTAANATASSTTVVAPQKADEHEIPLPFGLVPSAAPAAAPPPQSFQARPRTQPAPAGGPPPAALATPQQPTATGANAVSGAKSTSFVAAEHAVASLNMSSNVHDFLLQLQEALDVEGDEEPPPEVAPPTDVAAAPATEVARPSVAAAPPAPSQLDTSAATGSAQGARDFDLFRGAQASLSLAAGAAALSHAALGREVMGAAAPLPPTGMSPHPAGALWRGGPMLAPPPGHMPIYLGAT